MVTSMTVSKRSVGSVTQHRNTAMVFVQKNERNGTLEWSLREVFGRQQRFAPPVYPASRRCGSGLRMARDQRQRRRCSWLRIRPGWGIGEAGWAANNNVTRLDLGPMWNRLRSLLCGSGPPPLLGCAISVASQFYSAGRSASSSAVAMTNLPARKHPVLDGVY
jgi:hypothetical protein